jgi:DNA-binding HxlR family transcriptional regulator
MEEAIMAEKQQACPAETAITLLGSKWKLLILRELFKGMRRFGELSRSVPGISQKMLTQQLRQMEEDGLVSRKIYPEVPPRVEYSLTDIAMSLKPVLDAMHKWGTKYMMRGAKAAGAVKGSAA